MRQRPDLIVPIHDRRQRRRYVTLKNFGWATLAGGVIFVGISIYSEMRTTGPANYGRLVQREISAVVEQKPVEVVTETPSVDQEQTHADPMLVQAAAREQWLRAQETAPGVVPAVVDIPPRAAAAMATGETDVVIVGGPEGVKIVQRERRKPLSARFGRVISHLPRLVACPSASVSRHFRRRRARMRTRTPFRRRRRNRFLMQRSDPPDLVPFPLSSDTRSGTVHRSGRGAPVDQDGPFISAPELRAPGRCYRRPAMPSSVLVPYAVRVLDSRATYATPPDLGQ